MKRLTVLITFLSFTSFAQTVNYDDVVVIVNDNSQHSIDIGNIFQNARAIPQENIIHVSCPTTEIIDSLQFEDLRAQIEDYLITNDMVDNINYIVTTKGVPLKISNGCDNVPQIFTTCSSVDTELTLILGPHAIHIMGGQQGIGWQMFNNPYYNASANFSRQNYGVYLVTRLDGYTVGDVYKLISNSGPEIPINQHVSTSVVDLNNATGGDSTYFVDNFLKPTADSLLADLWNTEVDYEFNPLVNQNDVFAYFTTGHGPLTNVNLLNGWTPGSVASMATCFTATTFDSNSNPGDNFILADLIAEGCTGAMGYVNCIYFSQVFESQIFVDRYYDVDHEYNLAESFYMAERTLSWQSVFVGDPKASVYLTNPNTASVSSLGKDLIKVYPNPSNGLFTVFNADEGTNILIRDLNGKVLAELQSTGQNTEIDLQSISAGIYLVEATSSNTKVRSRIVKQ